FAGGVEGGLHLVHQEQLLGRGQVVLVDEHVDVADRVDAVDIAPQLDGHALDAEAGGDHPGVEAAGHGGQTHHTGPLHAIDGTVVGRWSRAASASSTAKA